MKATTHKTALNGRVYSAIYTEWGWFVRGTDGYNSSDAGEYFQTKAQAMDCIAKAFKMIRLEMECEA